MRQRHQGGDVGTKERLAMPWLETQRPAEEGLAPGRLRPPLPRAGVVRGARLAALLLVASAAAAPAATPAAEAPPGLQLDDRATARSYEVLLRIDPAESGFSGRVALDL
ncbi:MAG TPA: hypothetical protein VMT16_04545, partial [Thermoanaerobaculia bacterium]|nr:hypothetical protein [Thermoanaerobaculia bacterium]